MSSFSQCQWSTLQICSLEDKLLLGFSASLNIESNPNYKYKQITISKYTRTKKARFFFIGVAVFFPSLSTCAGKHIQTYAQEVESFSKKSLSCLSRVFLFLMAFSLCESLGWLMGSCIVWTTFTSESSAIQNALTHITCTSTRTHTHTYPTMSLSLFYSFSLSLYH